MLQDGERLRLPPTPAELDALEAAGIPDEEDIRLAQKEREDVYKLPPPPMHSKVKKYWDQHPTKRSLRSTHQLTLGGPAGARARARADDAPHTVTLPLSPWEVPLPMSPSRGGEGTEAMPPAYRDDAARDDDEKGDGPAQYALDVKKEKEKEVEILPPPTRKPVTRKAVGKYAGPGPASPGSPSKAETSAQELQATSQDSVLEEASKSAEGGEPHAVALDVEDESAADAIMHDALEGSPVVAVHEVTEEQEQPRAAPPLQSEVNGSSHPKPDLNTSLLDPTVTGDGAGGGSANLSRQSSTNSLLPPPQRPSRARGRGAGAAAAAGAGNGAAS